MQADVNRATTAVGRRSALAAGLLACAGAALSGCASPESNDTASVVTTPTTFTPEPEPEPEASTAAQALTRLKAGNARFVAGRVTHPDQSVSYRASLAAGQDPYALVLSCVDSRVPPEIIFDQGLGDLFVPRTAGQVIDNAVLGSIQYGIAELKIPLLVVLGHEKCGAVKATLEAVEKKSPAHGNDIDALITAITPAVEAAVAAKAADPLDAAVVNNVGNIVKALKKAAVLSPAVSAGTLQIVGARYDLNTGSVKFL